MAFGTKKPLPERSGTRRTLADIPQWRETAETLRRLKKEEEGILAEIRKVDGATNPPDVSTHWGRAAAFATYLMAKVNGRPEPEPLSQADLASLAEKRLAVQGLIEQQQAKLDRLRNEFSEVLYEDWQQEHFAARRKIAKAVVELKRSWDAELALAHDMHAADAITDALYGGRLLCNFSNCAALPRLVQAMRLDAFIESNRDLLKD
jgi:hypothetical protein